MHSSYEIRVTRLNEVPFDRRMDTPEAAVAYWKEVIASMPWFLEDREICVAVMLNTRLRVTGHHLVSIGSLNESVAHPREVYRAAVAMNAFATVILMHNHPSGDCSPSSADCRMTKRIAKAGEILQIPLLDHVIIGGDKWYSFREAGLL